MKIDLLHIAITASLLLALTGPARGNDRTFQIVKNPDQLKIVQYQNKELACLPNKKGTSWLYGIARTTKKNKLKFRNLRKRDQTKRKRNRKQLKSSDLSAAAKKKLKSKINSLNSKIAAKIAACAGSGDGSPPPGSPPPGTPPQPGDPLAPLTRSPTDSDLFHLVHKFGFGTDIEGREAIRIGHTAGLTAAINYLFDVRSPLPNQIYTMEDWADGELDDELLPDPEDPEPEDLQYFGMERGILHDILVGPNPVRAKLGYIFQLQNWALNHQGVQFTADRIRYWEYLMSLRNFGFNPNVESWAREHARLGHLTFMQHFPNGNSNELLTHQYASALLGHYLPLCTDATGKPNHTNTDLDEVAKILSGWVYAELTAGVREPLYVRGRHVNGIKTVCSNTPDECQADGIEDYLNCAFQKPSVARFYARRISEFYITPDPSAALVGAIAKEIVDANYNLIPVLKTIARAEITYTATDRIMKHPIEIVAGFLRAFGYGSHRTLPYDYLDGSRNPQRAIQRMGYHTYYVPSPQGFSPELWSTMHGQAGIRNAYESLLGRYLAALDDESTWSLSDFPNEDRPDLELGSGFLPTNEYILPITMVNTVTDKLGIPRGDISTTQKETLAFYLNNTYQGNETWNRLLYDNLSRTHQNRKGFGLYSVLAQSVQWLFK